MAHIGMVSIPAPGHVYPSIEVVRLLVERGHRVSYVNDESFRAVVEDAGADLAPYASVLPRVNHARATDGDAPGAAFDGDAIDHLTLFQDEYEVMLPAVHDRFVHDRPDLLCYDIAGIAGRVVADLWGLPALQLSPTYVAWDGYEQDMAEFETWLRTDPRGAAMLARQAAMLWSYGVEEDPLRYLGRPPRGVVLVPESMQPHAERVDREVFTFVGPAVRRRAAPGPADPPAWAPPPGVRVLLVSLGTAFTDRPEFYRTCLEAFGDLDGWRVLLQVGRQVDLEAVTGGRPLPDHVEVHRWVPQVEVLEHADVFVTHAGMGGSNEGLATGTPMIAVPQEVDQLDNADSLVATGVAVRVDPEDVTADSLRAALHRVTSPDVAARSREVAAELARLGGAARAVEVVESLLPRGSRSG